MKHKVTIEEAIRKLSREQQHCFTTVMKHGSLTVEYYAPKIKDLQTPHAQDELYIVTSGAAEFYYDGDRSNCASGDVLFVPAGVNHRFENFTHDFSTWVVFYGPDGGEKNYE